MRIDLLLLHGGYTDAADHYYSVDVGYGDFGGDLATVSSLASETTRPRKKWYKRDNLRGDQGHYYFTRPQCFIYLEKVQKPEATSRSLGSLKLPMFKSAFGKLDHDGRLDFAFLNVKQKDADLLMSLSGSREDASARADYQRQGLHDFHFRRP